MLAGRRLEDPPVDQPQSLCRLLRAFGGAVGRVVVGQHDLQRADVGEPGDPLQGRHDRPLLVPGRDDRGHRRPLPFLPRTRGRLRRRHAVADRQAAWRRGSRPAPRDVGQRDRDHPRHHWADRLAKIRPPWRGHVHAERDVSHRKATAATRAARRRAIPPSRAGRAAAATWPRSHHRRGAQVPPATWHTLPSSRTSTPEGEVAVPRARPDARYGQGRVSGASPSACAASSSATGRSPRSQGWTSTFPRGRASACSAPTARARRRR